MTDEIIETPKTHPIENIVWVDTNELNANDYNPNFVLGPEMRLLEFSLLKQGWIQPILVSSDKIIIDGYHRYRLCHDLSPAVRKMTDGKVPVVFMDLSPLERRFLTIRINRAKGNHIAFKMHEIICQCVAMGATIEQICQEIGADKSEVELLLEEGRITREIKNHEYSKSWYSKAVKKGTK